MNCPWVSSILKMLMARLFSLVLRANRSALASVVFLLLLLCMALLTIRQKIYKLITFLMMSRINPLPTFSRTMPNGKVFHDFIVFCCKKRIPFRYDPFTKDFTAYPILSEDLSDLKDLFYNALSVTNSNT